MGKYTYIWMDNKIYFLWHYLAPIYFTGLPNVWIEISYWDSVWMIMLISIIKYVIWANNSNNITYYEKLIKKISK